MVKPRDVPWDAIVIWTITFGAILAILVAPRAIPPALQLAVAALTLVVFPGYMLTVALFVRREAITLPERGGLSVFFGIALVVLVGLLLSMVSLPISRPDLEIALLASSFGLTATAIWRRSTVPRSQRFLPWRRLPSAGIGTSPDKWIAVAIAGLVALGIGGVVYASATATATERFTELSLLNSASRKADIPLTVAAGRPYSLTVSVKNGEHRPPPMFCVCRETMVLSGAYVSMPWPTVQRGSASCRYPCRRVFRSMP